MLSRFSHVWLFATLWTVAHKSPLSMGFSRKECSGLPCPPPENLPHPGIEPASLMSPALSGRFFTAGATWEAHWLCWHNKIFPKHTESLFPNRNNSFFFFFFLAMSRGLQDLNSPTRDWTWGSWQWKCWVLTTGSPGKAQIEITLKCRDNWNHTLQLPVFILKSNLLFATKVNASLDSAVRDQNGKIEEISYSNFSQKVALTFVLYYSK